MENRSNAFAADGGAASANSVLQIREDWRLAREAHKDLQVAGMPRTKRSSSSAWTAANRRTLSFCE